VIDDAPVDLLRGVRLLSLDAGNTIVFLDHDACAHIVADHLAGVGIMTDVDGRMIDRAEGIAKRRLDAKQLLPPLPDKDITPAWGAFMATLVHVAMEISAEFDGEGAIDEARAADCTRALWAEHRRLNLWRKVPDGLVAAVAELRARGVPVAVVSNSEGQLQALFDNLGLGGAFDLVVDSHHAGVEKPDPRIFAPVLARFGVAAADALHLGDTFATDVVGARAAGMRIGLVDPFAHYDGQYPDVARVDGVAAVCRSIVSTLT
jgi:HAD superfamily hydrolase (TIGR01509 family)